jgi:hypothetical protein
LGRGSFQVELTLVSGGSLGANDELREANDENRLDVTADQGDGD